MIELILTVCLASAPTECRLERMPFDGFLIGCTMAGQFHAAEWADRHPKWRIKRWSCGNREVRA